MPTAYCKNDVPKLVMDILWIDWDLLVQIYNVVGFSLWSVSCCIRVQSVVFDNSASKCCKHKLINIHFVELI